MIKNLAIFFVLSVSIACGQINTKDVNENPNKTVNENSPKLTKTEDCFTMKFHYLLTLDYMVTPKLREIHVFLDEKAFSEENLKILFSHLSKQFQEPNYLSVKVKTDWSQIPLPSNCPPKGTSNMPSEIDRYDYHQAIFYRRGENEYFRYNPVLKTSDFKEIILKSKEL